MRRLIALCLLLITSASNLEAVVGSVRDGKVHHEDTATAARHAATGAADHGHEDGVATSEHSHKKGHDHGTLADHCVHQHGIGLTASHSFAFHEVVGSIAYFYVSDTSSFLPEPIVLPPRA